MNIKYSTNHFVFFIKDFHLAAYSYRPPHPSPINLPLDITGP